MQKVISEFGIIRKLDDHEINDDSFSEIFIAAKEFEGLKSLVFEIENDLIFGFSIKKGKEQIQVKNYVGLIEIKGFQLEILPKIGFNDTKEARNCLLKMLKSLTDSPFKTINDSQLKNCQFPLLEIFITSFLVELEFLLSQGLLRHFETVESNEVFLKGKLNVAENIHKNQFKATHFALRYDDFTANISLNKIIKSCLQYLDNQTTNRKNQRRIRVLLEVFDEIDFSENIQNEFQLLLNPLPQFRPYQKLISWAKIFLNQQSFAPFSGKTVQHSILFPTEILFENYVANFFKKYFSETHQVKIQNQSKHLIDNHLNKPKFKIIPDIYIQSVSEDAKKEAIFDTKWKLITDQNNKHNYGISHIDLYQIYAYGKKYGCNQLFLIYPANNNFRKALQVFDYEAGMQLYVIPFDINSDLEGFLEILNSALAL